MKLFILEDDPIQRERLETIITKLQDTLQIFCEQLIATHDPEVLLSKLDVIDSHHVYFLDLEINHEVRMGLEVAQEIRKKDLHGMIVFVTTHSELAPKTYAYKVSALDFIEKDQPNEAFSQQVEACLKLAKEYEGRQGEKEELVIKNKFTTLSVPLADVLYIETLTGSHKLHLVTKKASTQFYGKLREEEPLHERLFQCHKSYVVNLQNVVRIDKKEKKVYFENGESCFVSRRLVKELERLLLNAAEKSL